jgi:ribosomal protein L32
LARQKYKARVELELIFIALLLGLIPAAIAQSKGRSFTAFYIFGALIPFVAIPWSICMKPSPGAPGLPEPHEILDKARLRMTNAARCPFCSEFIRPEASVCKYCGRDMPMQSAAPSVTTTAAQQTCRSGHLVAGGNRFCTTCGDPLKRRCDNGHDVPDSASFCPTCGAALTNEATTAKAAVDG